MFNLNLKSSNSNTEKFFKYVICLFPVFFIILLVSHKFLLGPFNEDYINFIREDGPVEYATAVFFFLSFVFSVVIARNFIKSKNILFGTLYFLLAGCFLFVALEEISWGQRIFNFETPEFFSENVQNETDFHRLPIIQTILYYLYLMVGFLGAFLWMLLPKTQKYKSFKKFFVPKRFLMFYFLPVILFSGMMGLRPYLLTSFQVQVSNFFTWFDHEIVELLFSAGIFLFLLSIIKRSYTSQCVSNSPTKHT